MTEGMAGSKISRSRFIPDHINVVRACLKDFHQLPQRLVVLIHHLESDQLMLIDPAFRQLGCFTGFDIHPVIA